MKLTVTFQDNETEAKEFIFTKLLADSKTSVYQAKCVSASEDFVVKMFTENENSAARFQREQLIIKSLQHHNIIKYYPITKHNAESEILITEYAKYGDIFRLVKGKYLVQNSHIRTYFHQLIAGLEYMHSQRIAHLDLKLENLLIDSNFSLKIIDFDQSHFQGEKVACLGTNGYRAPEILAKKCTNIFAADIYSAGVILYALKTGQFPFAEVEEEGGTKIMSYDLFMEDNEKFWKVKAQKLGKSDSFFSEDFKYLLKGMLHKNPSRRFTIEHIKTTEWYNKPILNPGALKAYMNRKCLGFIKECEGRNNKNYAKSLCSILSFFHKTPTDPTNSTQESTDVSGTNAPQISTLNLDNENSSNKKFSLKIWECLFPKKAEEVITVSQYPSPEPEKSGSFAALLVERGHAKGNSNLDLSVLKPNQDANRSYINGNMSLPFTLTEICKDDVSLRQA